MRRGIGFLLVGLGVFLIVLALSLRFYVLPALLVTPIDQFAETLRDRHRDRLQPGDPDRGERRRTHRPPHPARRRRCQQ